MELELPEISSTDRAINAIVDILLSFEEDALVANSQIVQQLPLSENHQLPILPNNQSVHNELHSPIIDYDDRLSSSMHRENSQSVPNIRHSFSNVHQNGGHETERDNQPTSSTPMAQHQPQYLNPPPQIPLYPVSNIQQGSNILHGAYTAQIYFQTVSNNSQNNAHSSRSTPSTSSYLQTHSNAIQNDIVTSESNIPRIRPPTPSQYQEPNSECSEGKKKRNRTSFTTYQMMRLEQEYSESNYLDSVRRLHLSNMLQIEEVKIKTWFQNRRMREKKEHAKYGLQSSGLFNIEDLITSQNDQAESSLEADPS